MKRPLLIFMLLFITLVYADHAGLLWVSLAVYLLVGLTLAIPARALLAIVCLALLLIMWPNAKVPAPNASGYLTRPSQFEGTYRVGSFLLKAEELAPYTGQKVTVKAEDQAPGGARNPGSFDYRRYLRSKGILAISKEVELVSAADGLFTGIIRWRGVLLDTWWQLLEGTFGVRRGAALYALLTGDTGGFDSADLRTMRASQLGHLFAVSGLHVGIAFSLARRASLENRIPGTVLTLGVLGFYYLLVGHSLSFLRAVGLVLVAELCFYGKRPFDLLSALALVAFPFVIFRPSTVDQVAFQYSFGAVLIIGLLQRYVRKKRVQTVAVGVGLLLTTLMIGSYHFRGYSPAGYLMNPLLLPLLPLIMVLLWCFLLIGNMVPLLVTWLDTLVGYMWWVIRIGDNGYHFLVAPPPQGVLVALFVLLFLAMGLEAGSLPPVRRVLLLLCLLPVLGAGRTQEAEIIFFDVGHGDAQLIKTAAGESILIDAGSARSYTDLGDLLLFQGIDCLDHLILSHPHEDHYGGLGRLVARGIDVKRVYLSEQTLYNRRALMGLLATAPQAIRVVGSDDGIAAEGVTIRFLQAQGEEEPNAASLLTEVTIGDFRFLGTGDAERQTELALVDQITSGVDLLKVAHHGSKTSSSATFLERVQPKIAVISASGRYGLPDSSVRDRLDYFGVTTRVTANSGAVVLRIFEEGYVLDEVGVD